MTTRPEPLRPPEPPKIRRRMDLGRVQYIGVPVLLLMPVLALLDVFGERQGRARVQSADIELQVQWPTRTRHEQIHDIEVVVRNVSARVIDTLTVGLDSAYLSGFSAVSITPGAAQAWEVELAGMRPGEARHIVVAVDAKRYGRHSGPVTATAGGADTARAVIDTFIFP